MRRHLKIEVQVLITVAILLMVTSTCFASFSNPFGGMKKIECLDGTATIAICARQDMESRIGFWDEGIEVPRGCWLNISWDFLSPNASDPTRTSWIAVSNPLNKNYDPKKGTIDGGQMYESKYSYRMTIWVFVPFHPIDSTLSFSFGVRGRHGEQDKTQKILVPISIFDVDQFVTLYSVAASKLNASQTSYTSQQRQQPQSKSESYYVPKPKGTIEKEDGRVVGDDAKTYNLNGDCILVLGGNNKFDINLTGRVALGNRVIFLRNGKEVLKAVIFDVKDRHICADVTYVDPQGIKLGDKIRIEVED